MGSWQLVTAMVVAMTLGSAWPVGAEDPDKKDQKSSQTPKQSAPQQDKAPAETSKGRNAGPASGAQKIPGTGGAANAQPPLGTPPPTTMPAANTLFDPKQDRPQGNTPPGTKVVTPEFFKSKEEVARELANPGMPAPEKVLERRTGADVLRDVKTTVTPDEGKNQSTTRQQQSELTVTGAQNGSDVVITLSGNRGSVTWTATDGKLTHETITVKDKDATTVLNKDYGAKTTTTITVSFKTGEVFKQVNDGKMVRIKTPNPETDTGDGHVPKGIAVKEAPKKSPSEIEAELRRQVTDPSDDQRRQFERMKMEATTALKSAAAKRTAGRIDENPVGDGPVGAAGNPKQGAGAGCVQVDCLPKGSRPVGGTGQATGSERR